MPIAAGDLDRRIEIERDHPTRDGHGNDVAGWRPYCKAWAKFMPGPGRERREAAKDVASLAAIFRVRRTAATRALNAATDRILFDNVVWDIASTALYERDGIDIAAVTSYAIVVRALSGAAAGVSSAAGAITITAALAGAAAAASIAIGDLTVTVPLAGAAAGRSAAAGAVTVAVPLAGAAAGVATAAGAVSVAAPLAAAALAQSSAAGAITVTVALAGASAGQAAATGAITVTAALAGAASAVSSAAGDVSITAALAGAAFGQSNAAGDISVTAAPTEYMPDTGWDDAGVWTTAGGATVNSTVASDLYLPARTASATGTAAATLAAGTYLYTDTIVGWNGGTGNATGVSVVVAGTPGTFMASDETVPTSVSITIVVSSVANQNIVVKPQNLPGRDYPTLSGGSLTKIA